jgi:hypothetical protein
LRAVSGAGIPGWLSTGASTAGSTAMARAYPPVKHMPTAPTPGPPHSACAWAVSARSQVTTGLVRSASSRNSRDTHTCRSVLRISLPPNGAPGRPKRDGRYTR